MIKANGIFFTRNFLYRTPLTKQSFDYELCNNEALLDLYAFCAQLTHHYIHDEIELSASKLKRRDYNLGEMCNSIMTLSAMH